MFNISFVRGDEATDPPCQPGQPAPTPQSWCSVLARRSLLFVGDSLSLQMVMSLVHLAANRSTSELATAVRLAKGDWPSSKKAALCGGAADRRCAGPC